MNTQTFEHIYQRAADRKGGKKNLNALLSTPLDRKELAKLEDSFFLAHMTRCVFNAGFVWKIVEHKWHNFERVFLKFDPQILLRLSDEQWEKFSSDESIIRHHTKIKSIKDNAQFIYDLSFDHERFGCFLAEWPSDDQIGLLAFLKKRGSRLGGMSGQYFLRFCGYDGFTLSKDVVMCIQDYGCDINSYPTSKRDLKVVQEVFNQWHQETGLNYTHLSQIAAYSIGKNHIGNTIFSD